MDDPARSISILTSNPPVFSTLSARTGLLVAEFPLFALSHVVVVVARNQDARSRTCSSEHVVLTRERSRISSLCPNFTLVEDSRYGRQWMVLGRWCANNTLLLFRHCLLSLSLSFSLSLSLLLFQSRVLTPSPVSLSLSPVDFRCRAFWLFPRNALGYSFMTFSF